MAWDMDSENARALIQIKLAAPAIPYCGPGKERKSVVNE
jgi:DNA topoisomerase VI subunit B